MEHEVTDRVKHGSASDISYSLRGMDFPAEKDELIQRASQQSANKDVMDRLSKIEDRQYDSIADVIKQVGKAA